MTPLPPSRKLPLDDDALLARGLEVFRADAVCVPAPDLAARVLARARAGDVDAQRFERVARVYAAAAAVLLVAGVGGSVIVHHPAPSSTTTAQAAPRIDDIEASRLAREQAVTLDDQRVGGK